MNNKEKASIQGNKNLTYTEKTFKTKAIDFKIFTGITNEHSGAQSQSASFYTNFYFLKLANFLHTSLYFI